MDDYMILEMLRSSKPSCSEWQPNLWVFRFELLEYTLKHIGHVCSLTNIFSPAKFETPRVDILIGEQRLVWMKFLWHVFTFERFHFSIVQFFPPKLQILQMVITLEMAENKSSNMAGSGLYRTRGRSLATLVSDLLNFSERDLGHGSGMFVIVYFVHISMETV